MQNQQKSKIDPLDPYQNYHFKDQNSPISETALIREKQLINEKIESLGKNHPVLITLIIIISIASIGWAILFFNSWIQL